MFTISSLMLPGLKKEELSMGALCWGSCERSRPRTSCPKASKRGLFGTEERKGNGKGRTCPHLLQKARCWGDFGMRTRSLEGTRTKGREIGKSIFIKRKQQNAGYVIHQRLHRSGRVVDWGIGECMPPASNQVGEERSRRAAEGTRPLKMADNLLKDLLQSGCSYAWPPAHAWVNWGSLGGNGRQGGDGDFCADALYGRRSKSNFQRTAEDLEGAKTRLVDQTLEEQAVRHDLIGGQENWADSQSAAWRLGGRNWWC